MTDVTELKTITFDPAVYKLVPIALSDDMRLSIEGVNNSMEIAEYEAMHKCMLAAVSEQLQGVVEHSGEPVAWNCNGYPFTNYAQAVAFAQANMFPVTPLYFHPAHRFL